MRVLVTGAKGQLGYEVVRLLQANNFDCIGTDRSDFDITNTKDTIDFIKLYKPDVVVHCSAYTAVDKAEEERDVCRLVNVFGTKNIASACRDLGAKLVYISSDYVFSGEGTDFWTPDNETNPVNWYGQTKLDGEDVVKSLVKNHFIIRISWAFGQNGNNFVKTMIRLGKERSTINVVGDQIGSPTYMADLAKLIVSMIQTDKYGTYHASNEGICSWAEFANEIFKEAHIDCTVKSISSKEYPTLAKRPLNSRLNKDKLTLMGFNRLPDWKDALHRFIKELD